MIPNSLHREDELQMILLTTRKNHSRTKITPTSIPRLNTTLKFKILADNRKSFSYPIPLKMNDFLKLLQNYSNPTFPHLLADIIKFRAKIDYEEPKVMKSRVLNH